MFNVLFYNVSEYGLYIILFIFIKYTFKLKVFPNLHINYVLIQVVCIKTIFIIKRQTFVEIISEVLKHYLVSTSHILKVKHF